MKAIQKQQRAGFTLLDILLAMAIMTFLIAAFGRTVASMMRTQDGMDTATRLQEMSSEALREILGDLRRSGRVSVGGKDFPYLFEDGVADDAAFAIHDHPAAMQEALPTEVDFGPNREIVFVLPDDADMDTRPDVSAGGQLLWSADEISYVVIPDGAGLNQLQRRVNGGDPQRICSNIERITFDDFESSGFQVPLGAIRVEIWFRLDDPTGLTYRHHRAAMVRLGNGL